MEENQLDSAPVRIERNEESMTDNGVEGDSMSAELKNKHKSPDDSEVLTIEIGEREKLVALLSQKNSSISQLEENIKAAEDKEKQMKKDIDALNVLLLRKDMKIRELEGRAKEKNDSIDELKTLLSEKETEISQLQDNRGNNQKKIYTLNESLLQKTKTISVLERRLVNEAQCTEEKEITISRLENELKSAADEKIKVVEQLKKFETMFVHSGTDEPMITERDRNNFEKILKYIHASYTLPQSTPIKIKAIQKIAKSIEDYDANSLKLLQLCEF